MRDANLLNVETLQKFTRNFFGYGELSAPIWFVGMEEAGGESKVEIKKRLDAWVALGEKPVDDLAAFHEAFGDNSRFVPKAPVQRTWKELMRVMLMLRGEDPDLEALRQYQIKEFGRKGSQVALLELMPLPKPAINAWPYADWTDPVALPDLQSIAEYEAHIRPARINALRQLILKHTPKAVVFYGKKYQRHWESICALQFQGDDYPLIAENERTIFLLLPHPVARGTVDKLGYAKAAMLLKSKQKWPVGD